MPKQGYVYLIGAGPGDPGLITVKGLECIGVADVIMYDYLANDELLGHARRDAEVIYAGKVGGEHNREQSSINDLLVAKALEGKVVARLKGGDPFIFGRGGEECEALVLAGIPFEVVPGVTAGIGAAAYAGIPLTHRHITTSVAFVTGHESPDKDQSDLDWSRLSLGNGTIVFYMGMKNLGHITESLMAHGRPADTPVALIRWGTRPNQQVLIGNLSTIAAKAREASFKAPAITVVGQVVGLRDQLQWFDSKPLFGKSILVTRAADQAGEFSHLLQQQGAAVLECPTIKLLPLEDPTELDAAIARMADFHWLVLTSANGVRYFFQRLKELGKDARWIGRCRVCAVGPKTAETLAGYGIAADLVPKDYKGEGVVAAFRSLGLTGERVLFPRAEKAREVIEEGLTAIGLQVTAPVCYRNVLPEAIPAPSLAALEQGEVSCITFTSSSTVEHFAALTGEGKLHRLLRGVAVASIGPITSKTCTDLGLKVDIEPKEYTLDALTREIVSFFLQDGR
jgi:uroporphyrinogen III methyltransferase/synthase